MVSALLKNCVFAACLMLVALEMESCSDPGDSFSGCPCDLEQIENSPHEGLFKVDAVGLSTILGTDLESAKASDRPKMGVSFDYDFHMGVHEVTCGEFNSLMESETGLVKECENENLPVTNVTYYDAILYANARSKREGLDTAYAYSGPSFDGSHSCIGMEKLEFDAMVDAYRLPTEAEWVLVASLEWNADSSWNNGNSNYERHEVCSMRGDRQNFCDMAGNAMEWVNDWLGTFRDTTVANYMGALNANSRGERVLKGGSYVNAPSSINLYSRGDVYTVTSATSADYIGFRLAFGKIENGTWIDENASAGESRSTVKASLSEMRRLLGTYRSKLAFRNDMTGNIALVNFAGGYAAADEIRDTLDCYHPEISPDGSWLAFSTRYEGVPGTSALYARSLNRYTDLVRLDVESAAIPRWRVLENGDTVIVYVDDAGTNKSEDAFRQKSTWMVPFANGAFGTPEKLFDGNYHGGISDDAKMAVTGSSLLRVAQNGKESVWYNGEQACNASLSPYSLQTLFLDFGGNTGREFAGTSYGTHERILIGDSTGKLVETIAAPEGFEFDHTEWSVGDASLGMVAATLTNRNGAHEQIVVVDPADSSVTEVVYGEELWHPCLWVERHGSVDKSLDLDSAGAYYSEGADWAHQMMRIKMGLLWQLKDSIETLCVGSSRVEDGIVPSEMKSGFALNMGHPDNDLKFSLFVAENYGLIHLSKLRTVVIALDFDLWRNQSEFYDKMVKGVPGYAYDMNHDFWKDSLPDGFVSAVSRAYPALQEMTDSYAYTLGYSEGNALGWGEAIVESDSAWCDSNVHIIPWQLGMLEDFIAKANERNVNVVGVIFPQNPGYAQTGSWGRYGPTRSAVYSIMDSLDSLEQKYENFSVLDENKMGEHDYTDSMAQNSDHLAKLGAYKLTSRLDSLISNL